MTEPDGEARAQPVARRAADLWGIGRAIVFLGVWVVVAGIVTAVVSSVLASGTPASELQNLLERRMLLFTAISYAPTPLLVWVFRRGWDRRSMASLGLRIDGTWVRDLVTWLVVGCGVVTAIVLLMRLCGDVHLQWRGWGTVPGGNWIDGSAGGLLLLFIIQTGGEEWICRGYLLQNFRVAVGDRWAVIVTSILFAVAHGVNPGFSPLATLNVTLIGCVFAVLTLRWRSLAPAWGLHCGWNFALGSVYGLPVSGIRLPSLWTSAVVQRHQVWFGGQFGVEEGLVVTCINAALLLWLLRVPRRGNDIEAVADDDVPPSEVENV